MTHAAVAAAIAALDRDGIARARWFGAKGRRVDAVGFDEAFVLDEAARHVLAVVALRLSDETAQRYTLGLTGAPLRVADPGDGAWRARAAAMGEGRVIATLLRTARSSASLPGAAANRSSSGRPWTVRP